MAQPLSPLSISDVLEWENAQDTRNEFCRGAVFAIGDTRRVHGLVAGNLSVALKVPLRGPPCRAFGVSMKVQVANDAELGALAEHVRGTARDVDDLVYVSAERGVGGGVISAGRPLRGTRGYVGELGHLVVRPGGRACYCGSRGCWETEVGEAALCRALGLAEDTPRGVVVAELRSLATVPRPGPLDEFAEWLAVGLVTVVNILAPELVVLGDLFTALPRGVVDHVRGLVQERSLVSRAVGGVRIETSPLGRDATLVGAAELAFEPVLGAV